VVAYVRPMYARTLVGEGRAEVKKVLEKGRVWRYKPSYTIKCSPLINGANPLTTQIKDIPDGYVKVPPIDVGKAYEDFLVSFNSLRFVGQKLCQCEMSDKSSIVLFLFRFFCVQARLGWEPNRDVMEEMPPAMLCTLNATDILSDAAFIDHTSLELVSATIAA
jgi:hypothetical protein